MNEMKTDNSTMLSNLIAPPDFENGWRESMTADEYHADLSAVGSGSLMTILQSPYAFYRKFIMQVQEEREVFRVGKMVHMALLERERFQNTYRLMPKFTGFTKDGKPTDNPNATDIKQKKAAWLSDLPPGGEAISMEDLTMILGITTAMKQHKTIPDVLKEGKPELIGYYRDPETGIRLKIMPDFVTFNFKKLTEIKTARDCGAKRFGSSAFEMQYPTRLFMYQEGIFQITGIRPELNSFISLEKKEPYECAHYYLLPEDFAQPESDYRRALRTLKTCIETNSWPLRQMEAERITTPQWYIDNSVQTEELHAMADELDGEETAAAIGS